MKKINEKVMKTEIKAMTAFVNAKNKVKAVLGNKKGEGYVDTGIKIIISVVIGEGGSGGALALCHSDRIWMTEDAYFSVVSPESCANILWKDTARADEAAKALCLTADKLLELGLIDRICRKGKLKELSDNLKDEFKKLMQMKTDDLIEARYQRFRKVGYR